VRKLLIVPHALQVEIGGSFLDRRSFKVRTASDGGEALAMARIWRPELILLASSLRDMSPATFCEKVRRDTTLGAVRLLMITSELATGSVDGFIHALADAHLVQPIEEAELLGTVGALLNVRSRRAPRLPVELLGRVTDRPANGEPVQLMANVLTLSEHGLLLECEQHLTVGAMDTVTFYLPGDSRRLQLDCAVLFADEYLLHYGVEFVGIGEDDRGAIRSYVEAQLGGPVGDDGPQEESP
jgi:DNA-binding response OmpR family regulator